MSLSSLIATRPWAIEKPFEAERVEASPRWGTPLWPADDAVETVLRKEKLPLSILVAIAAGVSRNA